MEDNWICQHEGQKDTQVGDVYLQSLMSHEM